LLLAFDPFCFKDSCRVWLETGLESRNVGVQDDITWGGRLMNDCKPLTENFGLYTLFWSNQLA